MYRLNVNVRNIHIDTRHQDIIVKKTCGKPVIVGNKFSIYESDGEVLQVSELRAKSMGILEDRTLVDFGVRLHTQIMRQMDTICLFLPDDYGTHLTLVTSSGNIGIYGVQLDQCDIRSLSGNVEISSTWIRQFSICKDKGELYLRCVKGGDAIISNLNGYTQIERSLFRNMQVKSLKGNIDTYLPFNGLSYDICTSTSGEQCIDPHMTGSDSVKLSLISECGDIKVACKKL